MSEEKKYKEMGIARFFARYPELTGYSSPQKALYQTIRELVENSLDAIDGHEEGRQVALPLIKVVIEEVAIVHDEEGKKVMCRVTAEDNGVGVPPTVIANAFAKVLYSSKYVTKQTRGMYGIGVKAAVMYSQATGGSGVDVISTTSSLEDVYWRRLKIDLEKNEPIVLGTGSWRKQGSWRGTRVSMTMECDWPRARQKIIEYFQKTSIIAPYVQMLFLTPEKELYVFPKRAEKIPDPPREAKPHPHGVDVETFKLMLRETKARTFKQFLMKEFQSVGEKSARAIIREAKKRIKDKDISGDISPADLLQASDGSLAAIVDIMKTLRFQPPKSKYLSPLGEDLVKASLISTFNPEWADAIRRSPRSYQGHPFIVELGMAYGGHIEPMNEPLLLRYANKVPLLSAEKEDVSYKVMMGVDWKQYKVTFPAPLVILVHVVSTKIPYKSMGKESISEVPEIEQEIRYGLLELGRRLREYLSEKERREEAMNRALAISKYLPEIARGLKILEKEPRSWTPLEPGEERDLLEDLIKLVSRHVHLRDQQGEEVVRKILRVK
ncbi:MAG: DNA topoisomerase VI subunit B [Acidilobaceae archaeon]|nr:DNA topoisomerase VI subunit B [Acidilobaceae archaeon]